MTGTPTPDGASSRGGPVVLIRGGGDLATGVAARLWRAGMAVAVTEIARPLAIRRLVALAEAIYAGEVRVEDLVGIRVASLEQARWSLAQHRIPVLVDPQAACRHDLQPDVLVDARMRKMAPEFGTEAASLVVGLGPGFTAGIDCHAVVETRRGHHLGRVLWQGPSEPDTGVPEPVGGHAYDRVLRAPADGELSEGVRLGARVSAGMLLARVGTNVLQAPFDGVLRGLLHDGLVVRRGQKVGDVDPRGESSFCYEISDKALAVGGGVLEAVLSRPELRRLLGAGNATA
jgi:xanthine dehydrogenase accessory factor